MGRVAILCAGGLALAGCTSFSPGDWFSGGGYPIRLDSDPPGAEARTSLGPACRTPCIVNVPARDDFTVTFALAGYEPLILPVSLLRTGGFGSEFVSVQFDPNPVIAQLQPAAPPQVGRKKKAKPRTAAKTGPASGADRVGPPPSSDVPPTQRTIPGAQPTAPASAWPPPR